MRALSIRQPFAELILRGVKTVEYRTRPTRIIGERFYIYAAKKPDPPTAPGGVWSLDLAMPGRTAGAGGAPPPWMLELAELLILKQLPTGLIVGSAVIDKVTRNPSPSSAQTLYEWHLTGVERAATPRKPTGHPQPVWFTPF